MKTTDGRGLLVSEIDWLNLSDRAAVDPGELKRRLDLVAVCESLGIMLEPSPDGKWHGLCPFHDDHDPSFDVYERDNGTQACGCMSCDFGPSNDVYDLIRAIKNVSFGQALGEAQALAASLAGRPPRQTPAIVKRDVDVASFVSTSLDRAQDDQQAIQMMLLDRGIVVPTTWLLQEFGLGVTPDGAGVVVPHRNKAGEVTAAKIRRGTTEDRPWKPIAVSGSKLNELYGVWRDRGKNKVILVEGESDTWTVAWLMRYDDCEVFGLPSGAAARPRREWIELLSGRDVTLLMDADDAGRLALRNWASALGIVDVALLNEGKDPSSEDARIVYEAIAHATTVGNSLAAGLIEGAFGGYMRVNDQEQRPISDFVLRLERTIRVDDEGSIFDVSFPNGRRAMLPASELSVDAKFRAWVNAHDYTWHGGTKDSQEILRMLVADSVFRPRLRGTRVAGWHDGSFVFPDPHGSIGGTAWSYLPPVADMEIAKVVQLTPDPRWDRHVLAAACCLHRPDVVTPLLGWIAAAPLRALIKSFPVLAVVGGAGWGKSTLISECLSTFGFHLDSTLSATTPHAVASFVSATNAVPVWFDEYRRGAREDTRLAFEQIVRDAWDASASWKGGLGENKQALTRLPARAPIIVSGEDAFSETSHIERMVMIRMPSSGRSEAALTTLRDAHRHGLGRSYLTWLVEQVRLDTLPAAPNIPNRPQHARAIAAWGYAVLNQFCRDMTGHELPVAYDDSLVSSAHAAAVPPTLEAISVLNGRMGRGGIPVVWNDAGDVCVRIHDLVRESRDLNITLAGGPKAIRAELDERFITFDEQDFSGSYVRLRTK